MVGNTVVPVTGTSHATFWHLAELPDNPHRMGRHHMPDLLVPELDAFGLAAWFRPLRPVDHTRVAPIWDQDHCDPKVIASLGGDPKKTALGNCTANGALGTLMTAPFHKPEWGFTEDDCVRLYHQETQLDDSQIPGEWPPTDTGSSGPWSMMTLQKQGLIRSWMHTRSLHTALRMLVSGPISVGVPWYRSMFQPGPDGQLVVDPGSGLAGGHQFAVTALDLSGQRVRLDNSWGGGWGLRGSAWLAWHDLDLLLHSGGDAVQPVL